jgi:hypothetical protein
MLYQLSYASVAYEYPKAQVYPESLLDVRDNSLSYHTEVFRRNGRTRKLLRVMRFLVPPVKTRDFGMTHRAEASAEFKPGHV